MYIWGALLVATALSAIVMKKGDSRNQITWWKSCLLAGIHTVTGVVCVKVFAGLEAWESPFQSGMSLFGAIFFLPILYYLVYKFLPWDLGETFDRGAMCIVGTLMIVRTNCIVTGCCQGNIIPGTDMQWPTRELEIIFWMILFLYFWKRFEKHVTGSYYPKLLLWYGVFRFVEEFLRQGNEILGVLHMGHIWALIAILLGSIIFFVQVEAQQRKTGY